MLLPTELSLGAGTDGDKGGDVSQPFTWTCLPPREEKTFLNENIGNTHRKRRWMSSVAVEAACVVGVGAEVLGRGPGARLLLVEQGDWAGS